MKALKDKVRSIHQYDVIETIENFCFLAHISSSTDVLPLGSTLKVEVCGDIDLAIDKNTYNPKHIHSHLIDCLGKDNCIFNSGTMIGSYAVPICGNKLLGRVQVDLMFVNNIQWADFIYHSPGNQSKYKGAVRAILLGAVAASINDPERDYFEFTDNGELLIRVGWGINSNVGLKRMYQIRPKKVRGEGYVKKMKNVLPDEIKQLRPAIEFDDRQIIIDNPQTVTEILFGQGDYDITTSEKIIELIKKRHSTAQAQLIFDIAGERASQLQPPIPLELTRTNS